MYGVIRSSGNISKFSMIEKRECHSGAKVIVLTSERIGISSYNISKYGGSDTDHYGNII